MVEKGIRGGIYHAIYQNVKANIKYMKDCESSHLKHWGRNNQFGWAMSQRFPVNDFKLIDYLSEFRESFMKSYNGESD